MGHETHFDTTREDQELFYRVLYADKRFIWYKYNHCTNYFFSDNTYQMTKQT